MPSFPLEPPLWMSLNSPQLHLSLATKQPGRTASLERQLVVALDELSKNPCESVLVQPLGRWWRSGYPAWLRLYCAVYIRVSLNQQNQTRLYHHTMVPTQENTRGKSNPKSQTKDYVINAGPPLENADLFYRKLTSILLARQKKKLQRCIISSKISSTLKT